MERALTRGCECRRSSGDSRAGRGGTPLGRRRRNGSSRVSEASRLRPDDATLRLPAALVAAASNRAAYIDHAAKAKAGRRANPVTARNIEVALLADAGSPSALRRIARCPGDRNQRGGTYRGTSEVARWPACPDCAAASIRMQKTEAGEPGARLILGATVGGKTADHRNVSAVRRGSRRSNCAQADPSASRQADVGEECGRARLRRPSPRQSPRVVFACRWAPRRRADPAGAQRRVSRRVFPVFDERALGHRRVWGPARERHRLVRMGTRTVVRCADADVPFSTATCPPCGWRLPGRRGPAAVAT